MREKHWTAADSLPAITLTKQSISSTAPTTTAQFGHHLSLLTSPSDPQRRDSLAYLFSHIQSLHPASPLPQPLSVLFSKLNPLLLDGSASVRAQLLKLFQHTSFHQPSDIAPEIEKTLLYIRAGLTHIAPGIQVTAIQALEWVLDVAEEEVVICPGGWIKTLKTLCVCLNWPVSDDSTLSASKSTAATNGTIRPTPGSANGRPTGSGWTTDTASSTSSSSTLTQSLLTVLARFLSAGLKLSPAPENIPSHHSFFPLAADPRPHLLPTRSNPFAALNLFGPPPDADGASYEDPRDRRRVFRSLGYEDAVGKGVAELRRAGGEVGRAAGKVAKVLEVGMVGLNE